MDNTKVKRARIPTTATRDEWIDATTTLLAAGLGEMGYTPAQCRELAVTMHAIDPDAPLAKRQAGYPGVVLRAAIFGQQGLDAQAATALAQLIRLCDLTRTVIPTRAAARLLDVHRMQIMRYRDEGKLTPATDHRSPSLMGGQQLWWLDEVLALLASERQSSGRVGRGQKRFPGAR